LYFRHFVICKGKKKWQQKEHISLVTWLEKEGTVLEQEWQLLTVEKLSIAEELEAVRS
jgi:hypothetical protein